MRLLKRTLSLILSFAILMALFVGLVGCDNSSDSPNSSPTTSGSPDDGTTSTYDISVKSFAGAKLSNVDVYVYADSNKTDLKQYGKTDENGFVSFEMPKSDKYAIEIKGLPKGYNVEDYYTFTGNTALINISTSIVKEDMSGITLGVGDVMYDMDLTTPSGEKIVLSEILKEKKAVLLNFWYVACSACELEFPYMQEAYEMYSDDIEIIAVNPLDTAPDVESYQTSRGLTFKMATCPYYMAQTFNVTGYPTSVLIDRYGVICLVEKGALTSLRPFTSMFDHITAKDYNQKLCSSIDDLITKVKPNKTMDTSENIGAAINSGNINVTYRPETESSNAEYAWPFIIDEKYGRKCIYASNSGIEDSYAIIYADIELKKGQAIGFDYIISSEALNDMLIVLVQQDDIYAISGLEQEKGWQSCYPWVALEDGTYELALLFSKDSDTNEGDDTVYISNMRVVDVSEIDCDSYVSRNMATEKDDGSYEYADIFYNEKDGYYHVGSKNGPLLLADLMNITMFNEEKSIFDLTYNGDVVIDGVNMYDALLKYFSYASNSSLQGICTVTKDLAEKLQKVGLVCGFDNNQNEWLKVCKYFQYYGPTEGKQLMDPIEGLATFSAPSVFVGKNLPENFFYYDRAIIPRGTLKKFVPTKTGVYRITSKSTSIKGVNGWIFNDKGEIIYEYEHFERMYEDSKNVSMVYYMEAGTPYYIDIAFWDVYEVGTIPFDIEYLGKTFNLFQVASPGYYTYDTDATGENLYETISGGIKVVLGTDGYYYHDLGKDANGKQIYGSKIYADFTGLTVMSHPIASQEINSKVIKGIIEMGGFDFSKSEHDQEILRYFEKYNKDVAATKAYLRELWGDSYDMYAAQYMIDDIFAGRYHGVDKDRTNDISSYLSKMITSSSNPELNGCVAVDEQLAELLQLLADKYVNPMDYSVEFGWLKLCYYYEYLGA